MHSQSVMLQLFVHVVLCDCVFVFSSVICQLMCAMTDLCVICTWSTVMEYNVNCDNVSKVP